MSTPDRPARPSSEDRHVAMVWLAAGDTPPARLDAATDALKAEGMTPATALAELRGSAA